MDKLTIGEKVYIDTFGGFLKGIVLDVDYPFENPDISGQTSFYNLTVKVISKTNKCYAYNEILHSSGLHVIPRKRYHKTDIFTFYVYPDYYWSKSR